MSSQVILMAGLTFTSVTSIGLALISLSARRNRSVRPKLQGLGAALADLPNVANKPALLDAVDRLGAALTQGGGSRGLKEKLSRAGYYGEAAAPVYLGVKFLLLVLGLTASLLVVFSMNLEPPAKVVLAALGGALPFFLPNIVVSAKHKRRCAEVRGHLPDAVDLLEVCVSAGMGLDRAWGAVTEEIRRVSSILADEMAVTQLEVRLGGDRAQALRHMAERNESEDTSSLAAFLVQSERFGTSLAETLRTFAATMREIRSQRAEERAEKMAVKLLLPMVLFIFPVVLILLIGPAGIRLAEMMRSG
ncbi:MAG: type II secretion system F family protein [Planctomycetota bacterium]